MKVKHLIKALEKMNANNDMVFYILEDYTLKNARLETLLNLDNRCELTLEIEGN